MIKKEYSNGEITIVWQPDLCIHAGVCVHSLPEVYRPSQRPWVNMANATSAELRQQVAKCPSGALSIKESENPTIIVLDDNGKNGRFALYVDGVFAGEMTFVWAGETKIIIDHTEIGKDFNGKGYGNLLLAEAVEFAREKHLKIVPLCQFVKSRFDKDPSISDVKFSLFE